MTIEGLEHLEKDGWELVRIGKPVRDIDWFIDPDGKPKLCDFDSTYLNRPIIRKIEKPKQYRPFANGAEFEPHRDRWIRQTQGESVSFTRVDGYGDAGVTIQGNAYTYRELFDRRTFDQGNPFGVEVQS